MKIKILLILTLCLALLSKSNAQNIPLDSLDQFVDKLMNDFEVTGLALGIVQNDSVIYSKGFGLRETGKDVKKN